MRGDEVDRPDPREVQVTLRTLAGDPPVEYPPRKELILSGRAALVEAGLDPDDIVPAAVDDMLREGIPPATRETYEYQWGRFIRWCSVTKRNHLPATVATMRFYIWSHWIARHTHGPKAGKLRGRRGRPYAPATVETATYAISIVHQWLGHPSPTRHPSVRTQLRGYEAMWTEHGYVPDAAEALSPADSVAVARSFRLDTVNGLRNAAAFRLQFDMGARVSEVVGLNVSDLRFDGDTVAVRVRKSKGNRKPRTILVERVRGVDDDVDPVVLLTRWVDEVLRPAGRLDGPLFPELGAGQPLIVTAVWGRAVRPERWTRQGYEKAWDRAVVRAGVDRDPVTGATRRLPSHCNRAGLIHHNALLGTPREDVAARTGHSLRSGTLHRYFDQGGANTGDRNAGTRLRRRPAQRVVKRVARVVRRRKVTRAAAVVDDPQG